MIKLTNGATVHAAFIVPAAPGSKPNGLVLAESPTDWVTWVIYWDGAWTDREEGQTHELWECESGHYFHSKNRPAEMGDAKMLAEHDFGLRLRYLLAYQTKKGINAR